VFRRYGYVSTFCGAYVTDIDHIVPSAVGGDDSLADLRPACVRCNRGRR
jgi:5-methylcytosine-specific restriction endonuclease McrA